MTRRPVIEPTWTRLEPGVYTWADYTIRREATTFGMRRASNPAWHVYRDGLERRLARRATLAEAKAYARADSSRRQHEQPSRLSEEYARDNGYTSQAEMRAEDWSE